MDKGERKYAPEVILGGQKNRQINIRRQKSEVQITKCSNQKNAGHALQYFTAKKLPPWCSNVHKCWSTYLWAFPACLSKKKKNFLQYNLKYVAVKVCNYIPTNWNNKNNLIVGLKRIACAISLIFCIFSSIVGTK